MKRICFVVDSIFSIGGVQRVTAVIAKELAKEYDVTIITFDNQIDKNLSIYELNDANINYKFFSYPKVGSIYNKLCKAYSGFYQRYSLQSKWASDLYAHSSFPYPLRRALTHELQKGNYDTIIGVHAPLAGRLATIKKHIPNTKCIGWIHNSFEALFSKNFVYIGAVRKRHYVFQFMKLDATVVLCNHDAKSYYKYDPKFKPTVIYNPLTLVPSNTSSGTSKRFLAVGRFSHKHKGFDLLIKAFSIFAKNNKEWNLDIVGEGPEEKLYRELIKDHNLEERIIIHPFTNNVQSYYSNAQVYVLSSRWEGFGLVLVEAMAHGLPVISSDLPTSLEILGDFGIYFENGNIEDLAQKLDEATNIEWQKKTKEALSIAQRFDIKNIIGQWKEQIQ